MGTSEVRDRLVGLVIARSRLQLDQVRDDDRLNFDLGYDSHALLNLLLDVEDHWGFEVPPERIPELIGIEFSGLVQIIEQHLATKEVGR
jgi:acyl carrier protein